MRYSPSLLALAVVVASTPVHAGDKALVLTTDVAPVVGLAIGAKQEIASQSLKAIGALLDGGIIA